MGYGKIETQHIHKNYWQILKYQYPVEWTFKSTILLCNYKVCNQNSFFLDAINHEAIKVGSMPTIKTTFLVMALCQKLPRPSFKSYVNNISLCQTCFLKPVPCLITDTAYKSWTFPTSHTQLSFLPCTLVQISL